MTVPRAGALALIAAAAGAGAVGLAAADVGVAQSTVRIGVTKVAVSPAAPIGAGKRGELMLTVESSRANAAVVAMKVRAGQGIAFPTADCDGNGGPRGVCSFTLALDPGAVDVPLSFKAVDPGRYPLRITPKPAGAAAGQVIRVGGLGLRVEQRGPRAANRFEVFGTVVGVEGGCARGKVFVTGITSKTSPPIDLKPVPGNDQDCTWGGGRDYTVNFEERNAIRTLRATYVVDGKTTLRSKSRKVRIIKG